MQIAASWIYKVDNAKTVVGTKTTKPKFEVKSLAMIAMMLTFGYLDICVQMMIWKVKFRAQCEFFVQKLW